MAIATLLLPFNLTVNVKTLKRLRKEGQLSYDDDLIKILFPMMIKINVAMMMMFFLCKNLLYSTYHRACTVWNDDEEVTRKPK